MLIAETAAGGLLVLTLLLITRADTCFPANIDDFNGLPGLNTFKDDVSYDFGRAPKSDSWTINGANKGNTVRGDGGMDDTANICVSSETYVLEPNWESLNCYSSMVEYDAQYDGMSGYVTTTVTQGYSIVYGFKVKNASTMGKALKMLIKVKGPGSSETGRINRKYSETTSFKVKNSEQYSISTTVSTLVAFVAEANFTSGEKCSMQMNITTCSLQASLSIPVTFDGWVGFLFDREVTYIGQGRDNKHKGWQASPSISYGMPADQLSSNISLSGSIASKSNTNVVVSCYNTTQTGAEPVTRPASLTPLKQRL